MPVPQDARRISDTVWEIPTTYKTGMRVPARIYATETLITVFDDAVFDQITNVATLPGVFKYVLCMPDGHFGYGFPIGGVAAMDVEKSGVISPGGIGFDINCGMRLVVSNLSLRDLQPRIEQVVDALYERIPTGIGRGGLLRLTQNEFKAIAEEGARWCVRNGYGWEEDLELTEEEGCIAGADSSKVSERAIQRGINQIGTLGSGNHYLEIQVARKENIFDAQTARLFGIEGVDQVVIMFHCGSRGFGHQVATDYLKVFLGAMEKKYGITVPDRELACAPFTSPEGQDYFAAMKCAINISFANRQMILHRIREVFSSVFGSTAEDLGLHMVYDVAHNTAKLESYQFDGLEKSLLVHRKGATRAFGPGMEEVPKRYQTVGQPVIIGGSMETGSYILVGVPQGIETFYSTAHGSGRTISRTKARKRWRGKELQRQMRERGIYVRGAAWSVLAEEAGDAYKDIEEVVDATEQAGISKRVARLVPVGNIKG